MWRGDSEMSSFAQGNWNFNNRILYSSNCKPPRNTSPRPLWDDSLRRRDPSQVLLQSNSKRLLRHALPSNVEEHVLRNHDAVRVGSMFLLQDSGYRVMKRTGSRIILTKLSTSEFKSALRSVKKTPFTAPARVVSSKTSRRSISSEFCPFVRKGLELLSSGFTRQSHVHLPLDAHVYEDIAT